MRHRIRGVFDELMYRKRIVLMVVIAIIVIAAGIYLVMNSGKVNCNGYECFQENMRRCTKATYVNEGQKATWGYEVLGTQSGECLINVKMLQAKEDSFSLKSLSGLEMECSYPKGVGVYPEKDLTKCHGRLKEELQTIIIEKLHTHIIDNLGKIDKSLNSAL